MSPPVSRRAIQVLPDSVVEKIAAGEVIERPASIVKELLENSLDAGATRVEIRLTDGGRKTITVVDDGIGIPSHEMAFAIKAHATSKISGADDLFQISSYGFRGEALSSMAAISQLDLMSRAKEAEHAYRIRIEGGELKLSEPYGMPQGTTVAVSNLFFNTPARRKFLKSRSTELGHVHTTVQKLALTKVECDFLLENDGEVVFHWPTAQNLLERIRQMYGRDHTEKLLPIEGSEGMLHVRGFVSNNHLSFSRPDEVWFFLNSRPIRDRVIQAAVLEGYRSALMERRYPFVVLNLTVPPHQVDVNVHPTKAEVRFQDSQSIYRLVSDSISSILRASAPALMGSLPREEPGTSEISFGYSAPLTAEYVVARTDPAPYLALEPKGPFSALEYIGTLDNTYLVLKGDKSLLIVDQHAAHERVHFERLAQAFVSRHAQSQHLLLPVTLELTSAKNAALGSAHDLLHSIGFEIELFGPQTYVIKAVPEILGAHDPRLLISDLLESEFAQEGAQAWKDHLDEVFSRIACHSAVRAHDRLSSEEIQNLLYEMDRIDLATNCPHGRPTFLKFGIGDLERLFRRK